MSVSSPVLRCNVSVFLKFLPLSLLGLKAIITSSLIEVILYLGKPNSIVLLSRSMLRVMSSEGPFIVPQENEATLSVAITLLMLKDNKPRTKIPKSFFTTKWYQNASILTNGFISKAPSLLFICID